MSTSALPLTGAVALVTGASDGIGKATALALAEDGAVVVALARRKPRLNELERVAANTGQLVHGLPADLTDAEQTGQIVPTVLAQHGRLDILVNNAGLMLVADPRSTVEADWMRMVQLNLIAVMRLTYAALPELERAANSGRRRVADIVNVGSLSARNPSPMRSAYAATKAGLAAFTDALRHDLAGSGVRVALLEPGLTETQLRSSNSAAALEQMATSTPSLASVTALRPERVAEVVRFTVNQPADTALTNITVRPASQRD